MIEVETTLALPDFAEKIAVNCVSKLPAEYQEYANPLVRRHWNLWNNDFATSHVLPRGEKMKICWLRREVHSPAFKTKLSHVVVPRTDIYWMLSVEIVKCDSRSTGVEPEDAPN